MRFVALSATLGACALLLLNSYGSGIRIPDGLGSPVAWPAAVEALSGAARSSSSISTDDIDRGPARQPSTALLDALSLERCDQLFVDGGSNLGEAVDAFLAGTFFTCATTGPDRIYRTDWRSLSKPQRQARMAALASPRGFCIRSFEPAPALLPPLRAREATLRALGIDVRFVHGALVNATTTASASASERREVVTYSGHPQGESLTSLFRFNDIHLAPGGLVKPQQLSARMVDVPTYTDDTECLSDCLSDCLSARMVDVPTYTDVL